MVEGKGEVTLPTAEINDTQHAFFGKVPRHIVDEFQKPVDLPELGLLRRADLAGRRHHADLDEEGRRLILGEQIGLRPVMLRGTACFRGGRRRTVNSPARPTRKSKSALAVKTRAFSYDAGSNSRIRETVSAAERFSCVSRLARLRAH